MRLLIFEFLNCKCWQQVRFAFNAFIFLPFSDDRYVSNFVPLNRESLSRSVYLFKWFVALYLRSKSLFRYTQMVFIYIPDFVLL